MKVPEIPRFPILVSAGLHLIFQRFPRYNLLYANFFLLHGIHKPSPLRIFYFPWRTFSHKTIPSMFDWLASNGNKFREIILFGVILMENIKTYGKMGFGFH